LVRFLALLLVANLLACRQSSEPPLAQRDGASKRTGASPPRNDGSISRQPSSGKVAVARAQRHAQPTSRRGTQDAPPADDRVAAINEAPVTTLPPAQPKAIDLQRLKVAGIRKLEGVHLTLYTDVPSRPEVDELPQVFDAAVVPWCQYFRVAVDKVATWKMTGYLVDRKERFQGTGLLPDDLPPFLNGYQRGSELWVYEQPSAYYRRHLLLHEGTHAFMNTQLQGCGPPWYMEGIAELMGTHRWQDGHLQLAYFPKHRDEVEQWGRIKLIHTEVAAGRSLTLESIADYGPTAHLKNEPYAWCWAVAAFLDGHPQFSARFRQLPDDVRESAPEFSASFWKLFEADRRQMVEQWQLFVLHLDYGYDLEREALVYDPPGTALAGSREIRVRAARGWQSAGVRVEAGATYVLEAAGRYQVAQAPRVWWCEPGGVTIRYYAGRPLGILLAAVSNESQALTGLTPLAKPDVVGLGAELECREAGTLFLRINEAPAELADNAGELVVRIRRKE
jgi:hypothetical protein